MYSLALAGLILPDCNLLLLPAGVRGLSIIHRLDARVKLAWLLAFVASLSLLRVPTSPNLRARSLC